MEFRGRGRGWGRGGFGGPPEPFNLFPEDVQLPDIPGVTKEEADLIKSNLKLQKYWESSPYYLEAPAKKSQDTDIERYSDKYKPNKAKRAPLSYHLKLTPAYFPLELVEGTKRVQHDQRNVRWNPDLGLEKFDLFEKLEKLEQKYEEEDGNRAKEKKEDENEDDDGEGTEEEDGEFSDENDYEQNLSDFDDDEDDFNMDEGGNADDDAVF